MTTANDSEAFRNAIGALGFWRKLRYALFTPAKLHRPVFEVPALSKSGGFEAIADCLIQHPGPYEIGIVCDAKLENPLSHVGEVSVVGVFRTSAGEDVARIKRASARKRAWWDGPDRNGVGLAIFAVPRDVPFQRPLRCKVEIFDPDGALAFYKPKAIYSRSIFSK